MLDLRETIRAAMDPSGRPTAFVELQRWFVQNPRKCGNCRRRTNSCPHAYIDVGRMLKIAPLPDNDPCPLWKPTHEYDQMDQAYVLAKLAHNFQS